MKNYVQCLIEGGRVCYAPCSASKEVEEGKGYVINFPGKGIWSGEANEFRQSFWDLLEDIMQSHNEFFDNKNRDRDDFFIYFGFHVTSEPMSWQDCETRRDMTALGLPTHMSAWDRYSDLTGYLWTDYVVDARDGHNPWEALRQVPMGKYITLKFSITMKEKS